MAKKVVLAYSGGLDTSVAVRWMIENLGCEVICVSANVGQEGTLDGNREKALGAGASEYIELDLREVEAKRGHGDDRDAGDPGRPRHHAVTVPVSPPRLLIHASNSTARQRSPRPGTLSGFTSWPRPTMLRACAGDGLAHAVAGGARGRGGRALQGGTSFISGHNTQLTPPPRKSPCGPQHQGHIWHAGRAPPRTPRSGLRR